LHLKDEEKGSTKKRGRFLFQRIGSTSSANITISENASPYESEKQQPIVDEGSNPVHMQTDDQNIMEPI
jgi:hypothetical protein